MPQALLAAAGIDGTVRAEEVDSRRQFCALARAVDAIGPDRSALPAQFVDECVHADLPIALEALGG